MYALPSVRLVTSTCSTRGEGRDEHSVVQQQHRCSTLH